MTGLKLFVVYHKLLHPAMYRKLSAANRAALTFYKVNEAIPFEIGLPEIPPQLVREYDLPVYDPFYQRHAYNEGSCIIHVHSNRLAEGAAYVGVVQYDMAIADHHLATWQGLMANGAEIIAEAKFGPVAPHWLAMDYIEEPPFFGFPMRYVVRSLCRQFGVDHASFIARMARRHAEGQQLSLLNSFIVRRDIFEDLAAWLAAIGRDLYDYTMAQPSHKHHHGHMSGLVERCVGLFFLFRLSDGQAIETLGLDHYRIADSHRFLFGQQ